MSPLDAGMGAAFRGLFRRSVQRGLRGVWVRGVLPSGPCVLAPNHHSWWDGYVLAVLLWQQQRPLSIAVSDRRMQEFGFFRQVGAVPSSKPRQMLQRLGDTSLLIFPEGELRTGLGELNKGVVWLAQQGQRPLVPVAVRVVLRGQEFPEAYVWWGEPLAPDLSLLQQTLAQMLQSLEAQLRSAPAETPLPDFEPAIAGRLSTHERMAGWARWLGGRQ